GRTLRTINLIELHFIGKANATDTDRIATLKLSLKTGSDAHTWFKGLDNTTRSTWAGLKAAFDLRWPERVIAAKTTEEKTSTLMVAELKSKDVGKRVTINGVEEWSHIAWADRVEHLTGAIPDSKGLLINQVRKKLPRTMHNLLGSHSSWMAFCQAVWDLPIKCIQESNAAEQACIKVTKELEDLKQNIALQQTPSKALAGTFCNISIGNSLPAPCLLNTQSTPAPSMPHPKPALSANNPFYTPPAAANSTYVERPWAECWADVEQLALPIHPNTPEGCNLYTAQLTDWIKKHGSAKPNKTCPYPLCPRSLPVTSNNCWSCGLSGHMTNSCPNQHSKAPENETQWRSIAATIKCNIGRNTEIPTVNFIADNGAITYTMQDKYKAQIIVKWISQGKVDGSSA
ncbi:hypothetical protein H0H87_007019, partial [Tephrocybe sp. NHM501043]